MTAATRIKIQLKSDGNLSFIVAAIEASLPEMTGARQHEFCGKTYEQKFL